MGSGKTVVAPSPFDIEAVSLDDVLGSHAFDSDPLASQEIEIALPLEDSIEAEVTDPGISESDPPNLEEGDTDHGALHDFEHWIRLSLIQLRQKDLGRALEYAENAQRESPNMPAVKQFIEVLQNRPTSSDDDESMKQLWAAVNPLFPDLVEQTEALSIKPDTQAPLAPLLESSIEAPPPPVSALHHQAVIRPARSLRVHRLS